MKIKTILVTGCAGFVGAHLCRALLKNKFQVIGIDNEKFSTKNNIQDLINFKNFTYYNSSINNKFLLKKIQNIDVLYHLAAVKLNDTKDNKLLINKNNVIYLNNFLKLINKKKIKKIIFTSSLYVYDKTNKKKIEHQKCDPYTNYGKSKLTGENILKKFTKNTKIQLVIFRLFFTYGLNQYSNKNYPSIIYKTLKRIISNKQPIIKNDGEQKMDYTHIDDVVRALQIPMNIAKSGVYNISSSQGISINKLILKILKVTKCKFAPIYSGFDNTKNTFKVGSNAKIKTQLGWRPKIKIEFGIKQIFRSLKNDVFINYRSGF
jgi:nucleoside-diphosphate-sugar epimerase